MYTYAYMDPSGFFQPTAPGPPHFLGNFVASTRLASSTRRTYAEPGLEALWEGGGGAEGPDTAL